MSKAHMAHLSAVLASGAISLPLLASTGPAFATGPRNTPPIGAQLTGPKGPGTVARESFGSLAAISDASHFYGTLSSTPQAFSVSKNTTLTNVSESPSNVTYGNESASVFSVTVTSHYGVAVPEGEKATVHAGPVVCTVKLKGDKGTCRVSRSALLVGIYPVSATYGGDAELSGSSGTSASKLTVGKDATHTTVSKSPSGLTHRNESVFSVTVTTHYGEPVPNGEKVAVHVGQSTCTALLKGGKGTCEISNTAESVGSYLVSATYGGDANLSGSSGSSLSKLTV
jgi:hypothetical protein